MKLVGIEFNDNNITKYDSVNIFELKIENDNLIWKYKDTNNNNNNINLTFHNTYYEINKDYDSDNVYYLILYNLDDNNNLSISKYIYDNNNIKRMYDWKKYDNYYKLEMSCSLNDVNEHINLIDYNDKINDEYEYIEEKNLPDFNDNISDIDETKINLDDNITGFNEYNFNDNIPDIDDIIIKDKNINIIDTIEKRIDPYDDNLYTKEEFKEYYGSDYVWDMQSPDKLFKLDMLDEFIKNYKHLSNQKFKFVYKQFNKIINS
jgi:hypothetical protein